MKGLNKVAALLCAALLSACATVPPTEGPGWMSLLREALTFPAAELEERAASGEARAQFSMGLIYQYGLQGRPVDPVQAAEYKRRALAARPPRAITQYIPGINGAPGRTAIISVPSYGVDRLEGRITDMCAQVVAAQAGEELGARACGSVEVYRLMSVLWAAGRF